MVVEGGRDCLSTSHRLLLTLPSYSEVARSAKSQLRLMSLPPHPNVIKLSSEAHYAAIEGTFPISLDFLYVRTNAAVDGDLNGNKAVWHNYAWSLYFVSDGGSCGAARRIFSWDLAVVRRLIWRQREEHTYLQKTGHNKALPFCARQLPKS